MDNKIQDHFSYFQKHYPDIYQAYETYGKKIHEQGGPLDEKTRWLIKISVSATEGYPFALKTHITKAMAAGCSPEEIQHTLLLLAPSVGFPRMMEALLIFREIAEQ
ncbi:carboxymuconolactone decarboxylase family protein [Isachenkonia alkalipeptolytica]|uniref:Carboxymuconolactone decarboxylase family protein n=1 Tax=Isachenkonia alkalipeptolytica TaxID=2565777 RepID=A0AA43XHF4_9CLOT|nr:carboxymuconolactone decarboxylase family protein [Isachenkonia alkalipeptolytica]NBG86927.1 carboxymuconolactone decarboxylase family protein [Isachenkonia alkalipeptolytica]